MPWVLWVVVASVVGYVAGKRSAQPHPPQPGAASVADPRFTDVAKTPTLGAPSELVKSSFAQGKRDGARDATADLAAKIPSRSTVTEDQIRDAYAHLSEWIEDPASAYALGYNEGYLLLYQGLGLRPVAAAAASSATSSTPLTPSSSSSPSPDAALPDTSPDPDAPASIDVTPAPDAAPSPAPEVELTAAMAPYTAATASASGLVGGIDHVPYWFRHPAFRRMVG